VKKTAVFIFIALLVVILTGCEGLEGIGEIVDRQFDVTVQVVNEHDEPLEDVDVIVDGDNIYLTDDNGKVELKDLEGEVLIEIDGNNYKPKTVTYDNDGEVIVFSPEETISDGLIISGYFDNDAEAQEVSSMEDSLVVDQIVLIYRHYYEIIDIENASFEVDFEREPGAMVFIDQNGEFAGYLALDEGFNSIPGDLIDEDTNQIDLGNIEIEDGVAYPEDGEVISSNVNIANEDLKTAAVAGSFFSAVGMSPDLVEALIDEDLPEIRISNAYYPSKIEFLDPENNLVKPEDDLEMEIDVHRLGISFVPGIFTDDEITRFNEDGESLGISLNNNDHSKGDSDQAENYYHEYDDFATTNIDFLREGIPEAGKYDVSVEDKIDDFSFELPKILGQAKENLIVPKAEVELYENNEGYLLIDSISWNYFTTGGNKIENPENILYGIEVQISSYSDGLIGDYEGSEHHGPERIFDSGKLTDINKTVIDLRDEEIYWQDVSAVSMAYDDLFDIHYVVTFINNYLRD